MSAVDVLAGLLPASPRSVFVMQSAYSRQLLLDFSDYEVSGMAAKPA